MLEKRNSQKFEFEFQLNIIEFNTALKGLEYQFPIE